MSGTVAEDQVSVKSEDCFTGRAKFLCSYGGRIMPRPHDSLLRYVGGETRILSVPRAVTFADLMFKLRRLCPYDNMILKYQLPSEDLDALVSVFSDEDLENMMEEYERLESKDSSSRLRLFLFPATVPPKQESSPVAVDPEQKFVEALNGVYRKAPLAPETPLEEQRKPVVLIHPASAALDKPHHVQSQAQLLGVPFSLSTSPVVPQAVAVQPPVGQVPSLVPHVVQPFVSPSVLPAPAALTPPLFHSPAPAPPPVLPTPAYNLMGVPSSLAAPKVVPATAPSPAVKVAAPGTYVPHQVIATRPVLPQVLPSSRPSSTYVPLVDVSRGILPKGMVIRQFSLEDDRRSDSMSSQTSLERRDSGEMVRDEDRYVRPLQDNIILQRPDVFDVNPTHTGVLLGGPAKVPAADAHLERYLMEQTTGEVGVTLPHPQVLYVPGERPQVTEMRDAYMLPRAASAPAAALPALQAVDVPAVTATALHPFHRQVSDRSEPLLHHQENVIPNVRACIAPEVVVQLDERFPTPVLHQLNGLRPQQQPQPQQQVIISDPQAAQVQKPIKVVPQVVAVNPFKVP